MAGNNSEEILHNIEFLHDGIKKLAAKDGATSQEIAMIAAAVNLVHRTLLDIDRIAGALEKIAEKKT